MQTVEIADVVESTNDTESFTLQRGNEFVRCDRVPFMETDQDFLQELFEEWVELALDGEEGYEFWLEH